MRKTVLEVGANVAPLPRVLYVVVMDPADKFGSMEEQMALVARSFAAQESLFMPLFVCPNSPKQRTPIEQAGVSIACLDMSAFHWNSLVQLLDLIRRHQIDVVHWNFSDPLRNSYLWWLTLLRPRVDHYYTEHFSTLTPPYGRMRGLKRRFKRVLVKRYSKVLCVSQFVYNCLATESTWSRLICCRHFVNVSRFRPNCQTRTSIRLVNGAEDRFVVLTVAHLIKEKGIDVLLRAMALLPENVVLWVVGTGVEAGELRRLTEELGLSARVVFHGLQQYVEPYMQGADCFVCPSLCAEAAGLVNLEAQASGLPVIASDIGGIPEYVVDGQTGFLFPPGDVAELADGIRRIATDQALRERLCKAARALIEDKFSPAARLDEMVDVYRA